MRKRWLLCALLGTLVWGQGAPGTPPAAQPGAAPGMAQPQAPAPDTSASVAPTAAVITVNGVCAPRPKAASAPGTGAKTATTAKPATTAKTAASGECKTVVTKEEFERLLKGVAPAPSPQVKKQLESVLPRFIAMSSQAQKEGLDKTPEFEEMMKFAKMQILTQELTRKIQQQAAEVPDTEIEDYYKSHPEAFEQFNLERLFVPRTRQIPNDPKEADASEKLTDDQKKAKDAAEKAKQDEAEQAMSKMAEDLRTRAAAGEDFQALQKEAFAAAGMKIESPTVKLPAVRRTGLPVAHAGVFDLKPGDVSQVINDSGGHYIYKLEAKSEIPLEQAKQEIHNTLVNQHTREMMDKVNNSYKADPNEAYFGPGGATPPMPHLPNRLPQVRQPAPGTPAQGAPGQAPPASQPPAQDPSAKPN